MSGIVSLDVAVYNCWHAQCHFSLGLTISGLVQLCLVVSWTKVTPRHRLRLVLRRRHAYRLSALVWRKSILVTGLALTAASCIWVLVMVLATAGE